MRFIDSIEPAGEAETVCIQVAAADSLYVTDDFLVTHNTLNDSLRHPRRGAEHQPGADEDVPHAARLRLEDGRHRRRHADRPAARPALRARSWSATSSRDVDGIEFVRFGGEDVVRHQLVQRIVAAYDEYAERPANELRPADPRTA